MLTLTPGAEISVERLEYLHQRREQVRAASRAESTLNAYRSDWRQLQTWAAGLGVTIPEPEQLAQPLPVGIIEGYLLDRSDPANGEQVAPASLTRHMSAVRWWHRQAGHVSPTDHPILEDTLAGIRRMDGRTPRRAKPIYLEDLRAMVAVLDESPIGLRDRALLTLGWWGAFRQSELVGIHTGHVEDHPMGVAVTLPRSKTDQDGKGLVKAIQYQTAFGVLCPVASMRAWVTGLDAGPVLRGVSRWGHISGEGLTPNAVARTVKRLAGEIGLEPSGYSGHSLRAGFVSECDRRGIPSMAVRMITGHKSDAMLSVYNRPRDLFESSAGAYFTD